MTRIEDAIEVGLRQLGSKSTATERIDKKGYSEKASQTIANVFAAELRWRGLDDTRPAPPGAVGGSGAERRIAGGIGAKRVDVTWATEDSGLLLGISIKTINFRDVRTGNFQKNLANRRGDMLFEAVTLHRRFPYSVLIGFMFFDKDAELDYTDKRRSTFINAHKRLALFTGRNDPAGRDEQYERMYIGLLDTENETPSIRVFLVGEPEKPVSWSVVFDDMLKLIETRNPDFYEFQDGNLKRLQS